MKKAFIKAISYYLPSNVLSNEQLSLEHPEWSVEKIFGKTGISNRSYADKEEFASDMAVTAAKKLFSEHSIDPSSIDFILYCSQSPDYFLPSTSCIIQDKLNLKKNVGALDFNLGCSGYIYGLALAKGLISASIVKNVLLITSETYTKYIHESDYVNRTIFGDASSATIVSTEGSAEILDFQLGTDGSGAESLIIKNGACRYPFSKFESINSPIKNFNKDNYLYMNGPEVFSFTSKYIPKLLLDTLAKNELDINEIDLFIYHQANVYMLNFLKKLSKIPEEKFFIYLKDIGNTVSSTIPIAIYEAQIQKKTKGNVLLCGFGVGFSWGGVVIKYT